MRWYLLILLLITYPIVELSRLIHVYYFTVQRNPSLVIEFVLMWLAFLVSMTIMARRLK